MAKRPIFHAEFGRYLAEMRERAGWSQSDAGRHGHKLNPLLSRNVILHLEQGKTKDPEPDILRALAKLYGVDYLAIAATFIRHRYGIDIANPDLPWQPSAAQSTPHQKGADVTAPTRVLEDLAAARRTIREMSIVANKIAALAAKQITVGEGRNPDSAQSGRGKSR